MNNNIVFTALSSLAYYMSPQDKKTSFWMFILLIISSLLDVFGLATLVPIIMAAAKPGSVVNSKYLGYFYHAFNFESEKSFLITLILLVLAFFLFKNAFTTLVNYQQVKFTAKIALKITNNQFDKHNLFPYLDFNKYGSAHLVHSTAGIPYNYTSGVVRQLFTLFSELVIIAIIILAILVYQPILFIILAIVLLPSTALTYGMIRNKSQYIGNRIDALRPVSNSILYDAFTGFIEIKLANKQNKFKEKFMNSQSEIQNLDALSYIYSQLPIKIIEVVAILAVVTIFIYSLVFSSKPEQLVTIIGLFAAAAYRLMPSVNRLINAMVQIKQHQYTWENLSSHREYLGNVIDENEQKAISFNKIIEFRDITFSFPGQDEPVLNRINLRIQKGERVGIIGASGSGKTTLMNLLLRFYDEQSGHIYVDHTALNNFNLRAWYNLIGYVKQDTFLMEASIKDNITLNDDTVDEERLQYALEMASLSDFVANLPEGVNSNVGERGSLLSGGQRQRIGIARALYKKTRILILDEATSALDNETEKEVNEAIKKLAGTDLTIFIIAHRLTTLRECNRIIELRKGEIIAEHQYSDIIN